MDTPDLSGNITVLHQDDIQNLDLDDGILSLSQAFLVAAVIASSSNSREARIYVRHQVDGVRRYSVEDQEFAPPLTSPALAGWDYIYTVGCPSEQRS